MFNEQIFELTEHVYRFALACDLTTSNRISLNLLRSHPGVDFRPSGGRSRRSPQFGAVYALNDGVSLYGSYGEGFRQQTGSDFQGNQFDPNITESAEIGLKADLAEFFDGVAGSFTVTLFQVDQSNILVNDDRPEATAAGFFSFPAGEARSRGLEIDANVSTDNGWNAWFSYAYVDAEFTNSNPDADFGAQINEGDPLICAGASADRPDQQRAFADVW